MRRLWLTALVSVVLAACGSDIAADDGIADERDTGETPNIEEQTVVEFTWTTTYVADGSGASIEVTGIVDGSRRW